MKTTWFKQLGWFYIPNHVSGYVITLFEILFMLPVCMAVIRNGHSVTDNLYEISIYGTCTAFWWKRVAEKTS